MMPLNVSHSLTLLLYKKLVCYFIRDAGLIHGSYIRHFQKLWCCPPVYSKHGQSNEAFTNSDLFVSFITHNQHTFL